jgi:hypothetical protein
VPDGGAPLPWQGFDAPPPPVAPDAAPGPSEWKAPWDGAAAEGTDTKVNTAPPPPEAYAEPDREDATMVAAVPEALLRATSRAPARPAASSPVPPADPDQAHFEQVYRDFLATRERCGEGVDGLTLERFSDKLRKNREQLLSKYGCKTVRFTVYVKEGKAALRAAPVKE